VDALLSVAGALGLRERPESGMIEIPAETNSRGLREVGVVPGLAPGLRDAGQQGMGAQEIARALAGGDLSALVLLHSDPLEAHPERPLWMKALAGATDVIAVADFLTPGVQEHATVVLPAESTAEKEGTVTHPDGRVQRVRQAIGHPGQVRPTWQVLDALCERVGAGMGMLTAAMVTARMAEAVPFLEGITLDEIGGRGIRWQDRDAATALPAEDLPDRPLEAPNELPEGMRLGATRSLWSGAVARHAPSLKFLRPVQRVELAPSDAKRLGVTGGDEVEVSAGEERVRAAVALRQAVRPGSVFLVSGTEEENATALMNGAPRVVEVTKV
jgi:NADH-quinone oxidoreductase subunit G